MLMLIAAITIFMRHMPRYAAFRARCHASLRHYAAIDAYAMPPPLFILMLPIMLPLRHFAAAALPLFSACSRCH